MPRCDAADQAISNLLNDTIEARRWTTPNLSVQRPNMANDSVPEDVRDFIQRHVDSVAQLEALLLLRANPNTNWSVAATAKRLYATEPEIADVLARLCTEGFLGCTEEIYRYDCRPAEREHVDRLAAVYARHLIPITNLIHAKPRRIRQFADAFKFRKDR